MRVFLDTNVVAAGIGTRGLCSDVLREVLLRHEWIASTEVEEELERALRRKFRVPPEAVAAALHLLRKSARKSSSRPLRELPLGDRADAAIVSAALNGRAEVLVTGDGEVADLGTVSGMEILRPRAFWDRVRKRP